MNHDDLLTQQIEYYEQRAAEYEDLYHRRGRFDLGPEANARYRAETVELETALQDFDATGSVLELACGTGLWTRFLARSADRLLAVDAAPSMIEINRARYGAPNVTYLEADVFEWEPPDGDRFDAIVFGFFVSHVPPERFGAFWDRLRSWLTPGGRVFFVDDVAGSGRPYSGHQAPGGPEFAHVRTLADGRAFTIVKRFFEPEALRAMLADVGWEASVRSTGTEFLIGEATPRGGGGSPRILTNMNVERTNDEATGTDDVDGILAEQHRYYEDRAPEYDDVWFRRGPYDLGPEGNAAWFEETAALERAVDAFGAHGDVLELACGTGLFTQHLVRTARTLTAVDASAATLEVNRARVNDPSVEYVTSDVFEWRPPAGRRYDEIVFTFFISHVPPERFAQFWARLEEWLKPGGRVFFADDLHGVEERASNPGMAAEDGPDFAHRRTLQDGREYTIVKILYTPESITSELRAIGWDMEAATTGPEFIYGTARPAGGV